MINKDFNSIIELLEAFPTEQACIEHLETLRWSGNVVSPFSPDSKVYSCKGNKYRCKETGKYFNVRTGTLFDNTKVKLQKWFLAIWLVTSHKKGISSLQLAKDIDVTQKTAWFMLQRIRNCFGFDNDGELNNEVEVDETYVGGNMKNMSNSKRRKIHEVVKQTGMEHKTPVLGMVQRGGKLRALRLKKAHAIEMKPILYKNITSESIVITDGFGAYRGIEKDFSKHVVVHHDRKEFAVGSHHTNTIEGFWSLLKRGIVGIYHYVSEKHLQKYVDEFAFRYNSRNFSESNRFNLLLSNTEYRLTYKDLING